MSKKSDQQQFQQYMTMLQNAITQANQPSPWEQQIGAQANNIQSFLDKRDYRNLPNGVNIPLMSLAESKRLRSTFRPNQGQTAAAGVINPQILAQQQELDDSQGTREWSGAYENAIGGLGQQKDDLYRMLMGVSNDRSQNAVGNYGNLLSAFGQKPKSQWAGFLPNLLTGLASSI